MTTLVDTNVLIRALNPDDQMHDWCVDKLNECKLEGPVAISDIVYCELSVGMPSKQATDEAIAALAIERLPTSDDALFTGGRAFKRYKDEHQGPKLNVLPDFLIGAQASDTGAPLLTCNRKDFVGYFPDVDVIAPELDAQLA